MRQFIEVFVPPAVVIGGLFAMAPFFHYLGLWWCWWLPYFGSFCQ